MKIPLKIPTLIFSLGALFAPSALQADLIALYRFDEASGSSAEDFVAGRDGSWIPGTLATPDWNPGGGQIGGAARFPGVGSHQNYFTLPGFPELNGAPEGMTISVWFKPDGSTGYRGLIMTRGVNGGDNYGIGHENSHLDGRVDSQSLDTLEGTMAGTGEWFHVAWVWDNVAGTQRFYINGSPSGSAVPVDLQTITSNVDWRVGDDACCNGRNLDGMVDDLSVWDEPLTSAEVSTLYLNGLSGFSANEVVPPPVTEPLNVGLVINEVHYDPDPKTDFVEFIEILNTGPGALDLSGYRFTEGVDFIFPQGTVLDEAEYLILAEDADFIAGAYSNLPQVFQYQGSLSNDGETLVLRDATTAVVDEVDYKAEFPWPIAANGEGMSMHLINGTLDNDLGGSWRAGLPSPGIQNPKFASNAPPQMRQVEHFPAQPTSSESTTISVKVSDPDGVASMTLFYQINAPGQYIPAFNPLPVSTVNSAPSTPLPANPAFEDPANWVSLTMNPDPMNPDYYQATVPAQPHRTLVRYRIEAEDELENSVRVPYEDDPSLNFAYFSYDGVPDYTAGLNSVHPGGPGHTYPSAMLTSLPVYHLITDGDDFAECWAYDSSDRVSTDSNSRSKFNWEGAFIYGDKVYDHVEYRLRQRNDRYAGGNGRRSMRFRFQRGNYFQALDPTGEPYPEKWRSMNTSKMSRFTEGANHGMRELVSSRLWNLAGVVAPDFQHVHFRVIDDVQEQANQYQGDFYGLSMIFEDVDARFVDSRNLPKGNIYKLKDGESSPLELQKYQARDAVTNGSDFLNIRENLGPPTQSDQWLRDHVDWDSWYLYAALGEGFRHYDFAPNIWKNRIWYFKPDPGNPLGKMSIIPHDTDATWKRGTNDSQWNDPSYASGTGYRGRVVGIDLPKEAIQEITGLNGSDGENHPERPAFMFEYRNTIREVRDLLWQPETVNGVIDQVAAHIAEFSLADRDRWDQGPAATGNEDIGPLESQVATMKNLAFVEDLYMGNSLAGGRAQWLTNLAEDSQIPVTPQITYVGPSEHPTGELAFESSDFSDPDGDETFGAIEWRVAEVAPPAEAEVAIIPFGSTWKYLDNGSNQGTAWQEVSFDDSSWASGVAPLGYGDGDEATVVSYGPDASNKYPTTYFRKTFTLNDVASLGSLVMTVYRDDGVVVHLNGSQVYTSNMPTSGVNYLTFATGNAANDGNTPLVATLPNFLFNEGLNTLAVEIHQRTGNSSDIGFELSLVDAPPVSQDPLHEWNATWESGALATFQPEIAVPAIATREGRLYRARVRHQDQSGRWSHWSAPYEFEAGAADASLWQGSLVISELMYHPASPTAAEILNGFDDDDLFEYIEIQNVGNQTLDLNDVRLTKGVDFNFFNSAITSLDPGQYVLVVNDLAAFEMRYGTGFPVAGEFEDGKLDNGGENVKLTFGAGIAIQEFEYDDASPWPLEPDGNGPSLVLLDPTSLPDHSLPGNWVASSAPGGSPGGPELLQFAGNPEEDLDGDGLNALLEYGFGSSDAVRNAAPFQLVSSAEGDLELEFELNLLAGDLTWELQVSDELLDWDAVDSAYVMTGNENNGDGTATIRFAVPESESELRRFYRLRFDLLP
ncbi:lamin tail domain-containing protein [Roseibacillus persicicus]|uniref:lamin tail domain-containing protein n=1 Tax=Roseibacillus persicicus TaxID=454148 RepID=UPI00398ACD45